MAYNHLETMDIYNLVARWHTGYTISQISRTQKLDRKTIRGYIKLAEKIGLSRNHPLPEKAELLKLFQTFLPTNPAKRDDEVQIDYGKLGLLYDPLRQKKRTVYAKLDHWYALLGYPTAYRPPSDTQIFCRLADR